MAEHSVTVSKISELAEAARQLIDFAGKNRVIALQGEMGAGKTTFAKAFCEVLGVSDDVTSPTFSLVNEYLTASGESIYHFDFYRIEKEQEAFDMGFEEYAWSGSWCLVEWPEKILYLLPNDFVKVHIEEQDGLRYLTYRKQ